MRVSGLKVVRYREPTQVTQSYQPKRTALKLAQFTKLQAYQLEILAYFQADKSNILKYTLFNAVQPDSEKLYSQLQITDALLSQAGQQISIFDQQQLFRQSKMTKAQRLGQSQVSNKRFLSFWSPLINRSSVFIGKEWVVNSTDVRVRGKLSSLRQFYTNLFVGGLWSQLHKSMVSDFFAVVVKQ